MLSLVFCSTSFSLDLLVIVSAWRSNRDLSEFALSWLANVLCFILSSAGNDTSLHPRTMLKIRSGMKAGLEFLFPDSKLCPVFMSTSSQWSFSLSPLIFHQSCLLLCWSTVCYCLKWRLQIHFLTLSFLICAEWSTNKPLLCWLILLQLSSRERSRWTFHTTICNQLVLPSSV